MAPQLHRTLGVSLVGALATASLGIAGVVLIAYRPSAGLLLVVPALACLAAFRAYMGQREQREHLEFLYESMRETQGAPEFGLAIGQLLIAARRLVRAEYAEIQLLAPKPGEPVLRSISGPAGEALMHPETVAPADQLAFDRIAQTQRPASARPPPKHPSTRPVPRRARARRRDRRHAPRRGARARISDRRQPRRRHRHVHRDRTRAVRDLRRPRQRPAREQPARAVARAGDRAAGGATPPGLPRRAHRPAQPRALHRPGDRDARPGAGRRDDPRRPLPRPRPLQEHQRQLGPRRR